MNLESRIEKLEQEINKDNRSDTNLELFDIHGNKVDAKILRMPMDWECGLAELEDGTEKEIAPIGNWRDVILASEEILNEREDGKAFNNEAEQEDYSGMLFLRRGQIISAVEMISKKVNNN